MIKTVKTNSSAINQVKYDTISHILTITFKSGNDYDYPGVPENEFEGLIHAESVGKYFNQHIKAYSVNR